MKPLARIVRTFAWLLAAMMLVIWPAHAQTLSIDTLITRIFGTETAPYDLTAELSGSVAFSLQEGHWAGITTGTFHEWREAGQPRHWKISLEKLELPVLLRPFSSPLQRAIEERAAAQAESLETLHLHDLFLLEESKGHYVLAGIRRDLVDEAIDRYGHSADKGNPSVRRAIAKWLYTAPTMRETIKRKGIPYALKTVVDEHGLVQRLTLSYIWGALDMTFEYTTVAGQPFWRSARSVVTSEVTGLGHVDGELNLNFSRHHLVQKP